MNEINPITPQEVEEMLAKRAHLPEVFIDAFNDAIVMNYDITKKSSSFFVKDLIPILTKAAELGDDNYTWSMWNEYYDEQALKEVYNISDWDVFVDEIDDRVIRFTFKAK